MQHIALIAIYLCFILAFNEAMLRLYEFWNNAHGSFLFAGIFIVIAFYLYLERLPDVSCRDNKNLFPIATIFLVSCLYSIGKICGIDIFQFLTVWLVLLLLQFALFQFKDALYISPAIILLLFCIPIFEYLTPILIVLCNIAVSYLLSFTDISVNLEGNLIELPYGILEISDGCSGVRFLISSLALGFYIIVTSQVNKRQIALIILLSTCLGLLFNWIRIFILVLVAYYSEMQSELVYDHETFGWLLFSLVVIALAIVYVKLESAKVSKASSFNVNKNIPGPNFIMIILAIAIGTNLFSLMPQNYGKSERQLGASWKLAKAISDGNSHDKFKEIYVLNDHEYPLVLISSSLNWREKKGDELVPFIQDLRSDEKWQEYSSENIAIDSAVVKYSVQKNKITNEERIRVFFFEIDNTIISSYKKAKLMQIPAFFKQKNYFAYHQLFQKCNFKGCGSSNKEIMNVTKRLLKELSQH